MKSDIVGNIAIVTGGDRRIGAAVSQTLDCEG
jgi:NAD(P)-dependent dehydrogenase (short-subunit alcohol dehydrogenase family)